MKFVIEIDPASCAERGVANAFANALRQLRSENHHIVVIYSLLMDQPAGALHDKDAFPAKTAEANAGRVMSSHLAAALRSAGVPAIELSGADGDCVRLRMATGKTGSMNCGWEAAVVNPFWLDVIALHGGVPIIGNVALGSDSQYHTVCADRLAAVCAVAWHADALIFFTAEDGIRSCTGSVMRWLEVAEPTLVTCPATNRQMYSKLGACYDALNGGVHRTRILPVSKIHSLSVFCSERIDFGTEVVMGASVAKA